MKITFIYHSAFLVETDKVALLFDYFKGELPKIDKPLYVLSSHFHQDHFSPVIFNLPAKGYYLSDTIKQKQVREDKLAITQRLHVNETVKNEYFKFKTLGSTDSGLSFLVELENKVFYHAGDNNVWYWDENDKEMLNAFNKNIEAIKALDFAFFPVDPRLEAHSFDGIKALVAKTKVNTVYPMHMWEQYEIVKTCQEEMKEQCIVKQITAPLWCEEI